MRSSGLGGARRLGHTCPKCGSREVQWLSVIYQEAVSPPSEPVAPSAAAGSSLASSEQQRVKAQLSRQAAPPSRKHDRLWIVAAVAAAVIGVGTAANPDARTVASVAVIALAAYFAFRARRYNQDVFPWLHAQWERSVMCGRCGHVYES